MTESITTRQTRQLTRIVEDAIDSLELEKLQAQSLIENGGKVKREIQDTLRDMMPIGGQYADEEARSSYAYPGGYAVKSVAEQLKIWAKHFPNLSVNGVLEEVARLANLPAGAEDLFVIPKWECVADTYGKAAEKMLDIIAGSRKFHNYRKGNLGPDYLRLSRRTADFLEKLGQTQTGDFLVIPAQFGLKHRGKSVRRARVVFADNEFGLGSFAVAAMLITHPEREQVWEQLHIDCAGDEYVSFADGDWSASPVFRFYDGRLGFYAYWSGRAIARFGSASGFLAPQ